MRSLRILGFAFLLLLVLAIGLELVATHAISGRSTRFLVSDDINGVPVWRENLFFPYRFFPARMAQFPLPFAVPKSPAPESLRVCLLGGSTAMGMPDPAYGLARQLQWMLEKLYPDRLIEILPLTLSGANSHVLREVARDLHRLQPHAVVVMIGNHEMVGPYGPITNNGHVANSPRTARLMAIASRSRLVQLIRIGKQCLSPSRGLPKSLRRQFLRWTWEEAHPTLWI